jgi:hypothetical protein
MPALPFAFHGERPRTGGWTAYLFNQKPVGASVRRKKGKFTKSQDDIGRSLAAGLIFVRLARIRIMFRRLATNASS